MIWMGHESLGCDPKEPLCVHNMIWIGNELSICSILDNYYQYQLTKMGCIILPLWSSQLKTFMKCSNTSILPLLRSLQSWLILVPSIENPFSLHFHFHKFKYCILSKQLFLTKNFMDSQDKITIKCYILPFRVIDAPLGLLSSSSGNCFIWLPWKSLKLGPCSPMLHHHLIPQSDFFHVYKCNPTWVFLSIFCVFIHVCLHMIL